MAQSNIVRLPAPKRSDLERSMTPTKRKQLLVFSTMEAAAILKGELESAGQKLGLSRSGTWKHIGETAGISYMTISKLADGTTMWPRFSTIYALFDYFGYELRWERRS